MRGWLTYLVLLYCTSLFAQKTNRLNKQGERTGRWITYLDSAKTKKSFDGKFRNGRAVGHAYYYTMEGVLERRETSRFGKLKTIFYYPDKTVRLRGKARIEIFPDRIHYYFYGRWKYYDSSGHLLKYVYYKKGEVVRTRYVDANNKTNDSLMNALALLEKTFDKNNADLLDSMMRYSFYPLKREMFQIELYYRDTMVFKDLDRILSVYGYPGTAVAHETNTVPFYILSYAPSDVKLKYLDLLKRAADAGKLRWKDLAFYIDKIKVAKGQKQVYGTQFYYTKKHEVIFYPSEDPEHLETRRKAVGLE